MAKERSPARWLEAHCSYLDGAKRWCDFCHVQIFPDPPKSHNTGCLLGQALAAMRTIEPQPIPGPISGRFLTQPPTLEHVLLWLPTQGCWAEGFRDGNVFFDQREAVLYDPPPGPGRPTHWLPMPSDPPPVSEKAIPKESEQRPQNQHAEKPVAGETQACE